MANNEFFDINIKGLAEVQKQLFKFSEKLGKRVTLLALRSGANFMLKQVRQAAPKDTGRLRRSIKVKVSRLNAIRRRGKVGVYITAVKGKSRSDLKGAYYAAWVEHGHRTGKGTGRTVNQRTDRRGKVKGKFFVKNTFNRSKVRSRRLIIRNLEQGGKKLVRQLKLSK